MASDKVRTYRKKKNTLLTGICSKCGIEIGYTRFRKISVTNIEEMRIEDVNGVKNISLCPYCFNKFIEFMRNNESYSLRANSDATLRTAEYMKSHGMGDKENIFRLQTEVIERRIKENENESAAREDQSKVSERGSSEAENN